MEPVSSSLEKDRMEKPSVGCSEPKLASVLGRGREKDQSGSRGAGEETGEAGMGGSEWREPESGVEDTGVPRGRAVFRLRVTVGVGFREPAEAGATATSAGAAGESQCHRGAVGEAEWPRQPPWEEDRL